MVKKNKTEYPRHDNEHYPTEPEAVRAALQDFKRRFPNFYPRRILDIGCGKGVWGAEAKKLWPSACVVGIDIVEYPIAREVLDELIIDNFLAYLPEERPDFIIGNPPFGNEYAEYFLRHALDIAAEKATIYLLYGMRFYSSKERLGPGKILDVNWPVSIREFVPRLSFIESGPKAGETDSDEHGMYTFELPQATEGDPIVRPLHWVRPPKKTRDRKTRMSVVPMERQMSLFDDEVDQPEVTTEVTTEEIDGYLSRVAAAGRGVAV